jgi:hypothetical protein
MKPGATDRTTHKCTRYIDATRAAFDFQDFKVGQKGADEGSNGVISVIDHEFQRSDTFHSRKSLFRVYSSQLVETLDLDRPVLKNPQIFGVLYEKM